MACSCLLCSNLSAREIKPPLTLNVYLKLTSEDFADLKNADWLSSCANFGKALTAHQGPIGMGAFHHIACHDILKNPESTIPNKDWVLAIILSDLDLKINIQGQGKNLGEIILPPPFDLMKSLKEPKIKANLALSILNHMPMMALIEEANYAQFFFQNYGPFAPYLKGQNFTLYHLSFDERYDLWKGQVFDQVPSHDFGYDKKKPSQPMQSSLPAWAHVNQSLGDLAKNLNQKLSQDYKESNSTWKREKEHQEYLKQMSKLHVVGVKYSYSLLKNQTYNKNIQYASFYYEYKYNHIFGLRSEVDLWPTIATYFGNAYAQFGGYRGNLGLVMHMTLLDELLYFEMTPRIGVWHLTMDTPSQISTDFYEINRFDTLNSMSLGFQGASHLLQPYFRLSVYVGYDQKVIKQLAAANIQSSHLGFNLFTRFSGVKVYKKIEFQIYLFSYNEITSISKISQNSQDFLGVTSDQLSYSASYVGLGLAYQW